MWIISRDYISKDRSGVGTSHRPLHQGDAERCTVPFQIYDARGTLYYEGRMTPDAVERGELDVFTRG